MTEQAATPDRKQFWGDVRERMVSAFAQGMLAALGVGTATFDKGGLPWLDSLYVGVGCSILALLISLAGGKFGDPNNGSFRKAPTPAPEPDGPETA